MNHPFPYARVKLDLDMANLVGTPVAASSPTISVPSPAEAREAGGGSGTVTPRSSENWQKPKFGQLSAGEITNTADLKTEFKKSVQVIAEQLRKYATTPGAELTVEQARFLELYKKDGTGDDLLKTESGAVLAHLMAEQEVFLRLAALKRQVELVRTGHLDPNKIKNEFTIDELQGLVRKHGKEILAVMGGVLGVGTDVILALINPALGATAVGIEATGAAGAGIWKVIQSARQTGKFKISDLASVDTSQLPDKYRKYIDYIAHSAVAQQRVNDFLRDEGVRQLKFYTALGVDNKHLNYLTPWQRLNIGTIATTAISADAASQNVLVDWMVFRSNALASHGAIAVGDTPAMIARKYFEAHIDTIQHYVGYEIGRIRGEQKTSTTDSLRQITAARDKSKSGTEVAEKKAKRQTELDKANKELGEKEPKLDTAKERINVLNEERAKYAIVQPSLDTEYDSITNAATGALKKVRDEISSLEGSKDAAIINFDNDYSLVPSGVNQGQLRAEISKKKADAVGVYEGKIEAKKTREKELLARQKAIEDERDKEKDRAAELTRRGTEVTTLTSEIDKLKKKTIPGLEKNVKSGLTPKEQKKLNQLEATIRGLTRYDSVFSDLENADTKDLSVGKLLSFQPEAEGGINYNAGYIKALKLIFNYEHPPEGIAVKDFFEAVIARLPQVKYVEILAKYYDVTIPAIGPFGFVHPGATVATVYSDGLSYTLDYIRVMKKPSQNNFNQAFFPIMEYIEYEGVRFTK